MKGVVLGSAQHSISRLAPNWQPANPPMTPPATQRITVSARADRCWVQLDPGFDPGYDPGYVRGDSGPQASTRHGHYHECGSRAGTVENVQAPGPGPGPVPPCQAQGRGLGPAISWRRESRPRERGLIFRWSGYSCLRNCTSPELRVKSSLNETEDSQK